jgi:hypothetical protein
VREYSVFVILPIVVSLAVRATNVTTGVVAVAPSVIVSETVNKPNRHSERPAVAVPPVQKVNVVAVKE